MEYQDILTIMDGIIFIKGRIKMNYQKEINEIIDVVTNLECLNLSIGANNQDEFFWINNNYDFFKKESIETYNQIINIYKNKAKKNLFFIIDQKKDYDYTLVEKHLGIGNKYKEETADFYFKTIYLANNYRFGYATIDDIKPQNFSYLSNKILFFSENDASFLEKIKNVHNKTDIFKILYNIGYTIFVPHDFYSEGNSLTFYSKNKESLTTISTISKRFDFK